MSENGPLVTESGEETDEPGEEVETGHLDDIEAGAGCTEIWEHLSERREQAGSD